MLTLKNYKLSRQGVVNYNVSGPNHCGPENFLHGGTIKMRYHVVLLCKNSLDANGFLVDNMFIADFMVSEAAAGTTLSCELLADYLANKLVTKCTDTEPTLEITEVCMSLLPDFGEDTVEIQATYTQEG